MNCKAIILTVIIGLLSPGMLFAQDQPPFYTAPKETIDKIKSEGMGDSSEVMKTASYLVDVIGGRLTNSPNMTRANRWTMKKLEEWGLQNGRLEPWGPFGRGWSLKEFSAQVVSPQGFPIVAYPKAWSPSTKGTVEGNVVHIVLKSEEDLKQYEGKLTNAVVLISNTRKIEPAFEAFGKRYSDSELLAMANARDPKYGGRRGRPFSPEQVEQFFLKPARLRTALMNMLIKEGAAAMADTSRNGSGGTVFVMGAQVGGKAPTSVAELFGDAAAKPYDKASEPNMIPQMTVSTEDYNRMVRMLEAGEKLRMKLNIATEYQDEDLMGYNTVAEIPGTDPALKDEIVMLGGHLDSWHASGGATDNASGVAVAMEAVRIIQKLGLKPRRTIRIALWSGEEQGLFGSEAYVAKHLAERKDGKTIKKQDFEKFAAYFNMDNGTGKFRGIYAQGNASAVPIFREWFVPFNKMGATTVTMRNTGGTDHIPFDRVGLPGFQFIQDEIEYDSRTWHSSQDNYDRLIADDLKHNSTIMAAFVYQTAMMDKRFPRKN